MRKYYISFSILTVVVILAVARGFWVSGSPFEQKALKYDSQRISRMGSIKYSVDSYYRQNHALPQKLDQLSISSSLTLNDPETQKPFEYKVVNTTNYELCTTFSTDTKSQSSPYRSGYAYTSVGGTNAYHSKGYDCIKLTAPVVYTQPVPTIYKEQSANTFTFYGTVDSIAKSDTQPRLVIKDDTSKIVRIFNIENADVINKNGEVISYDTFQTGDKVILDAPQSSAGYSTYKAKQVQNLSR